MPWKDEHSISLKAAYDIIKRAGAERVSEAAAATLRDILEQIGKRISEEAIIIRSAEHSSYQGKKTIKPRHIKAAYKLLKKREI